MWCENCQKQTVPIPSQQADGYCCAECGAGLFANQTSDSAIRQARDIVARWSSNDLLDQISALPEIPAMPKPHFVQHADYRKENSSEEDDPTSGGLLDRPQHKVDRPDQPTDHHHDIVDEATTNNDANNVNENPSDNITPLNTQTSDKQTSDTDAQQRKISVPEFPRLERSNPTEDVSDAAQINKEDNKQQVTVELTDSDNGDQSQSIDHSTIAELAKIDSVKASETQNGLTEESQHEQPKAEDAIAADVHHQLMDANEASSQNHADDSTAVKQSSDNRNSDNKIVTQSPALKDAASSDSQLPSVRRKQSRKAQPRVEQSRENLADQMAITPEVPKGPIVKRKIRIDVPANPTAEQPSDSSIELPKSTPTELNTAREIAQSNSPSAQNASNQDMSNQPASVQTTSTGQKIRSNAGQPSRRTRIDSGESLESTLNQGGRVRPHSKPRQRMIDDAHESSMRGPHFQPAPVRRTNFNSITGQFLAYVGVLGLTVGTAIVIYGHFGGYSDYTPTGWLVTTVAQMMLFLGVINLVSGGIEQTNDDVSQRIDYLGAQLMRIEQSTERALRGPKISPRRYAGDSIEEQETATVSQEM